MGDLDVLLERDQVERGREVLERTGYRPLEDDESFEVYRQRHFHYRLGHRSGFIVELHWGLSDARNGFRFDTSAIHARARSVEVPGSFAFRVPSPEDLILHMASQNEEDAFGNLRRLVDIDRIVAATPDLDWGYLSRAAREARLETFVALAFKLSESLFGTAAPATFVARLEVSRISKLNLTMLRPLSWVMTKPERRWTVSSETFLFWATVRWRDRARRYLTVAYPYADPFYVPGHGSSVGERVIGVPRAVGRLAKLALYQTWVYVSVSAAALTKSGRESLRFWRNGAGPRVETIAR
jgi:hypothetical protein